MPSRFLDRNGLGANHFQQQIRARFAMLVLAVFLSFAFVRSASAGPAPVATVQMVSASPMVKRSGVTAFLPLRVRTPVFVGDVIRTGARDKASLLFNDGSQVRLNANSNIEITVPVAMGKGRTSLFRAISGEVWSRLRPGQAVQAPNAVAGVRGTEFNLKIAEGLSTTLTVIEGEVEFYNELGTVLVEPSQQSVAEAGAAPTKPITIANPNFIIEWTADVNRVVLTREKFFVSLDRRVLEKELALRNTVLQAQPNDASAHLAYGDVLFDSACYAEAVEQYAAADKLQPNQTSILVHLGDAYFELGRLDEAEAAYLAANSAETLGGNGGNAAALVGTAWTQLSRERPVQAEKTARQAIALTQPQLGITAWQELETEARIALGMSLLRQAGRQEEALQAFETVAEAKPNRFQYQAHAWLAMLRLAQDNQEAALREARKATELAPQSSLSHANLALVALYSGDIREAQREVKLATELKRDSGASLVTLGQVLLAQGDVDGASRAAARAVALDPKLPQAQFLLGVADAGRMDYSHAERALKAALALSPNYLPAASALARVENRMGRPAQAVELLTAMLTTHPKSDAVQGALGEVYYEQGKYDLSASSYETAARVNPLSALYQAGLARTLLDANRLNASISAGQKAVQLAPSIGQYRAVLGLAYEYSGLASQAEQKFREALIRDPQNALALAQLAYKHEGADLRPAAAGFAQGFLLNPAIGDQLVRGGVKLELSPQAGTDGQNELALTHRANALDGRFHSFSYLDRVAENGDRANSDGSATDGATHLTFVPHPRTNVYATVRGRRTTQELAGSLASPDTDDEGQFKYGQAEIAVRQRVGAGNTLWAGLFGNSSRSDINNPQLDSFFDGSTLLPIRQQRFSSQALQPEIRFDTTLGRTSKRPSLLTVGAAYAPTSFISRRDLQFPIQTRPAWARYEQDNQSTLAYAQLSGRWNDRFSLVSQLRWQHLNRSNSARVFLPNLGLTSQRSEQTESHWLPSFLATYQASKKTAVRLSYNQRITDVTTSTLAPVDTLLSTESGMLPYGTPDLMKLTQLDVEHSFGSGDFLKLFLFRTSANTVQIGGTDLLGFGGGLPAADAPFLTLNSWQGKGIGARYERQLSNNLFANAGLVLRDTDSSFNAGAFEGRSPYEPALLGSFGMNYIDPSGNKVGLRLRHVGSFYQDSPLQAARSRFPARSYVDLRLARETSLRYEFFANLTNLFNTEEIEFNGFPSAGRRIVVGATRRF